MFLGGWLEGNGVDAIVMTLNGLILVILLLLRLLMSINNRRRFVGCVLSFRLGAGPLPTLIFPLL